MGQVELHGVKSQDSFAKKVKEYLKGLNLCHSPSYLVQYHYLSTGWANHVHKLL